MSYINTFINIFTLSYNINENIYITLLFKRYIQIKLKYLR